MRKKHFNFAILPAHMFFVCLQLQSHITIRHMCDRILTEVKRLKELETRGDVSDSSVHPDMSSTSPSSGNAPIFTSTILSNASDFSSRGMNVNSVAGDQRNTHTSDHSRIFNSGNVYERI
jgi:hypothetical protein